jgi:chromosomal replication initiation ATPase DnaA
VSRTPKASARLARYERRSRAHYRAVRYAERLVSKQARLITFHGPEGSGKTLLLDAIANHLAKQLHQPHYLTGPNLVFVGHHIERCWCRDELMADLLTREFLLIDDLDAALKSRPSCRLMSDVLTQRFARGLATAVTVRRHPLIVTPAVFEFTPQLARHTVCELAPLNDFAAEAVVINEVLRANANLPMPVVDAIKAGTPRLEDIIRFVVREFIRRTTVGHHPPTLSTLSDLLIELDLPMYV